MKKYNIHKKKTSRQMIKKLTVEQQIQEHIRHGYKNRLSEIVGKWPGTESIKETLAGIKD